MSETVPISRQYADLLRAIAQERKNREQSLLVLLSLTTLLLANAYLQRDQGATLSEEQQKQLVRLHRDYCYVVRRQMKTGKGNKKGKRNA